MRRRRSSRADDRARSPIRRPGTSRGKYVYCIIESADPLRFGPIGIGADPSDVYTVHYKNLAAVVSDAPLEVLDSTRENVLAHERVNETVMREHTVIPMSFGTIFKTREDIVELLRSAAEAFGDVLNKMQNKLEFGLKVLWDRDQAIREVEAEDEDISRLEEGDLGPEGPDLLRAHAVRPADRLGAPGALRALRRRDPRAAARRVGGVAHQQADRRQDDHERRVPDLARSGNRVRRQGEIDRQPVRQADVQVHGPVAAVQLRQHSAETGASVRSGKLDRLEGSLPLLPFLLSCILDSFSLIGSLRFVLDKIVAAAEAETQDDSALREQLLEAQMRLELGEITDEEFAEIETDVIARMREIKGQQQGPSHHVAGRQDQRRRDRKLRDQTLTRSVAATHPSSTRYS